MISSRSFRFFKANTDYAERAFEGKGYFLGLGAVWRFNIIALNTVPIYRIETQTNKKEFRLTNSSLLSDFFISMIKVSEMKKVTSIANLSLTHHSCVVLLSNGLRKICTPAL